MGIILQILVSSVAVYFTAWLLPGIAVKSYGSAILVAIVLGVLNALVTPILQFLSLPITVLTLGLFMFVINALVIMLASWILGSNFHVQNFWWALLFSIIVSLVSSLLNWVIR
ncbi:phage holin family protein [Bacteroidales bacterium OttesenSCG-928-K03]|nr:phage holin family protein [Odoribacter sp. OttesenSCG-928-L07]MDL2243166.1 phage holin family protein [Bacteroidales bacterium OttesenSCG-928-K03]